MTEMEFRDEIEGLILRCCWPRHEIVAVLREITQRFEWSDAELDFRALDPVSTLSVPSDEGDPPKPSADEPRLDTQS